MRTMSDFCTYQECWMIAKRMSIFHNFYKSNKEKSDHKRDQTNEDVK